MFDYVLGAVASRDESVVVLDVGGVGYRFTVSASTLRRVPAAGEAKLLAHLMLREERLDLFGFASPGERHLFRQLLQVGGIGPATALGLLSAYEPEALASHIASGETALLTRVKGIGKKTAERILVELRDRFASRGAATGAPPRGAREDALLALCSLGLTRAEAERRLAAVEGEGVSLEETVKRALRRRP
ncbi:MAG: Holliday junction branch migration protein RuvA [Planctomycetaceae bacterium]